MKEPFLALLKYNQRIVDADPEFAAKLNSAAADLLAIGSEINDLWNELEAEQRIDMSPLYQAVLKKEITLTPGEVVDIRAAVSAMRTATSAKELTIDDAIRAVYREYRYASSCFSGLRILNTRMLSAITTVATIAKIKK